MIGKDVPYRCWRQSPSCRRRRCASAWRAAGGRVPLREALFPELEYTFKHALTHEVAYGSLLQERRKALHARIMASVERLYADRLMEQLDRLAHHALRGEVWDKALAYSRQAAGKAIGRSAHREAWSHLEQAIAVLPHLPQTKATLEQAVDLRLAMRTSLAPLAECTRWIELGLEAEPLAKALNDPRREAVVHCSVSLPLGFVGRSSEAVKHGERGMAIAESLQEPMLRIDARHSLGLAHWHLGAYRTAIGFFQRDVGLEPEQLAARMLEPSGAGVFEQTTTRITYCQSQTLTALSLPSSGSSTRRCGMQSGA